jgi:hypothetical protein
MAQVKFYRGVRASYNSTTHANGIFFATDTHVIIMNNVEYGVSADDIAAIKGAIDGVTLTDPSTLTFSFVDETEHPDLTVKLVSYAAATDGALTFGTPDSTTKVSEVSLKLNANDKVLTKSSNGLLTNISMTYDSTNKLIKLLGKDVDDGQGGTTPEVISSIDATDFIKDGMIDTVELVTDPAGQPAGTYIKITFNTAAGKDPIYLDVTTLIDVYTAGNGLQLSSGEFSIKLADDNEGTYLQVGSGGLKITGIAAIQTQVTNIIASVGLGASEAYTNTGNYIGKLATNTVTSDISALDTQVKANADAIGVLNGDDQTSGSVAKSIKDAVEALDAVADGTKTAIDGSTARTLANNDGVFALQSLTEADGKLSAMGVVEVAQIGAANSGRTGSGTQADPYVYNDTIKGAKWKAEDDLAEAMLWNEVAAPEP